MKKIFLAVASIAVLIIALSFAYYLVIFLPSKEKTRQELELKIKTSETGQKTLIENSITECMSRFEYQIKNTDLGKTKVSGFAESKEIQDVFLDTCLKSKGIKLSF